jgi:roadblock/LC7 domain-containing protein
VRLFRSPGDVVGGPDPAFSPNGRILATSGGEDEILRNVADPARPTQIAVLPGYPVATGPSLFSPDGRTLANAYGGTLTLWNVAHPARVTRIATRTGQPGNVAALSFSPDGHLLASASDDGTLVLRNVAEPARIIRIATLTSQAGDLAAVSFSPDGHLLASASDDGTLVLRNVAEPAFAFIRLNRHYRMEAGVTEALDSDKMPDPPNYPRRTVLVFVDDFDLAAIAALRYARSLRPTALRAVHFVIDQPRADLLWQQWLRADRGNPLDLVDCPDRRVERAAGELVAREACQPGTYVTVVLPRRSYPPLLGRPLHDRTADKIARMVSRIPRSAATIIPFDVTARVEVLHARQARPNAKAMAGPADAAIRDHRPAMPPGVTPISSLTSYGRATVTGRVHTVEIRPVERNSVLACTVADASGELTALFYGRTQIPGLRPGTKVRLRGPVGVSTAGAVMTNPAYELLA